MSQGIDLHRPARQAARPRLLDSPTWNYRDHRNHANRKIQSGLVRSTRSRVHLHT
jgi:hypothetical protein